jgi:poly-gamma-glutamate capsule biosynthesis protein CapA/YwtB (metallophosphatase superfamily)
VTLALCRLAAICGRTAAAALALSLALAGRAAPADCMDSAAAPGTRMPASFRFAAVGDIIIQQPSLSIIRAQAPEIVRQLKEADTSFGNFESNSFELDRFAGRARPPPEGPLLLAPPEVPRELKRLGFTLLSTANNHAGDWGPEGVLATVHTLQEAGLVTAGTGARLAAARAPACSMAHGVAVALVAITATFSSPDAAAPDRAGVNALHLSLRDHAYLMNDADRAALLASIHEARRGAALVFVSLHTHEPGIDAQHPPQFEIELAHAAIDSGADAFFGHGPHTLRGLEIYEGRPVFYSLANFAVTQPPSRINPKPLSLPAGSVFTRRAFFESILAVGRYERGRLTQIELHPFKLVQSAQPATHGLPASVAPAEARAILERMRELSRPFGTQIRLTDGVGVVRVAGP